MQTRYRSPPLEEALSRQGLLHRRHATAERSPARRGTLPNGPDGHYVHGAVAADARIPVPVLLKMNDAHVHSG